MFKEELYNKVLDVLNLNTSGLTFYGGYHMVMYNGIIMVIDKTTTSAFDFSAKEVIPLSEEYNNETPSVNDSDRSDYVIQYQIMFKLEVLDEIKTALEEFRTYFYANKQHVIDGYNVTFKVTRGDKQPTWTPDGGDFYGRYKLTVYCTATKNGYLYKDTDKWEMRVKDTGDYVQLVESQDIMSNNANSQPDNATTRIKHFNTSSSWANKFQVFYDGGITSEKIYSWIANKENINTKFDLRETFNGVVRDYIVIITGGARTKTKNGMAILEFDVREVE